MKDDGYRLSFSISNQDATINDSLSGNLVIKRKKAFISQNINRDVLINHLRNLQEAMMTYKRVKSLKSKAPVLSTNTTLIIREDSHEEWTVSQNGVSIKIKNQTITAPSRTDFTSMLKLVNGLLADIISNYKSDFAHYSIVRRIADAGIVIWTYKEHTAVCYESNIFLQTMCHCLIDGMYYAFAFVYYNDDDTVSLYTNSYEEIIRVPVDDSIREIYKTE